MLAIHPFSSDALRRIVTYFANAHTEDTCSGSLPTEEMMMMADGAAEKLQ